MYKPYDYQQDILDQINATENKRVCIQLATGGGKTIIFTNLAKNYDGRVLILVDSKELVSQTAKHFTDGATFEAKDKAFPNNRIVVSMVQTLKSRLKKEPNLINDFDLIIIDEAHIIQYESILKIVDCKVLGFTATPVSNRKDNYYFCKDHKHMSKYKSQCCNSEKIEFTKEFSLSDIFDEIIVGIPIKQLIEKDFLVKDENYVIPLDDNDFDLDKFGEVSNAEEVFDKQYQMDVLQNYLEHCDGKKTMIFTQNTTLNLLLYNQFIDAKIDNCFMYDSVNDTEFNRQEVVEKFKNTKGAILFNVGVFTKGFDVTDVQAIIVSRRVSSLSLWIQIVGRGSRVTDKLFKDRFIVIDGGANIERLGRWSDDYDWRKLFYGKDDYKPKKEAPEEQLKECEGCGDLIPDNQCVCDTCEFNHCEPKEVNINFAIAVLIDIIEPNVDKILNYCEKLGKDKFFALKILNDQIYKMFKKTDKEQFERNLKGGVQRVILKHLKPNYIKIIRSGLPSKSNRTYEKQKSILLKKLNKKYGI